MVGSRVGSRCRDSTAQETAIPDQNSSAPGFDIIAAVGPNVGNYSI